MMGHILMIYVYGLSVIIIQAYTNFQQGELTIIKLIVAL